MLFALRAWLRQHIFVVGLHYKQSWTGKTAIACIDIKQICHSQIIVPQDSEQNHFPSAQDEKQFLFLGGNATARYDKCFRNLENVARQLICVGGTEKSDNISWILPQYPFDEKMAVVEKPFEFLIWWRKSLPSSHGSSAKLWAFGRLCPVLKFPWCSFGARFTKLSTDWTNHSQMYDDAMV